MPGVETRLPLLFSEGVRKSRLTLPRFVDVACTTPAALLGLGECKGRLEAGFDADVVVLDLDRIADRATFDQPNAGPEGFDYVLVGGEVAVDHDRVVRSDLGRALRK